MQYSEEQIIQIIAGFASRDKGFISPPRIKLRRDEKGKLIAVICS